MTARNRRASTSRPRKKSPTRKLPTDSFLDEELAFYLPLIEVCLQLPRVLSTRSERAFGTPFNVAAALAYLSDAEVKGISMSEFSKMLNLSNSRVTRLVNEMEEAGWVSRSKSKVDGRSNLVRITASGRRKLRTEGPFHLANIRELSIHVFSAREREMIRPHLERLRDHITASS